MVVVSHFVLRTFLPRGEESLGFLSVRLGAFKSLSGVLRQAFGTVGLSALRRG